MSPAGNGEAGFWLLLFTVDLLPPTQPCMQRLLQVALSIAALLVWPDTSARVLLQPRKLQQHPNLLSDRSFLLLEVFEKLL